MQSGSWVSKMKGGNTHRIRGKHFSSTLIFLVLMTVFLWSFEKKPPSTSLFSSPGHLDLPGSDATFSASRVSRDITERKYHAMQEHTRVYGEIGMESERLDSDDLKVDSTPLTSSRTRENDNESASALHSNEKEEAYPQNDENLELPDLDRGTDNEKRLFDGSNADFTQKNESDSTSFLENNHKEEAYPKNGKGPDFFDKDTVCNYAKGRWVLANRRPLYSGLKCKQWLSEMWACRLSERPDFTYESYRWQPENCEMPEFDRSEFMRRMQDKTIAFVGDSLGRQQFQSFMCMVTGGEEDLELQDVGSKYGFVLEPGAVRPNGWAFWFPETNSTILFYWSACLCDLEPLNSTDPATEVAMHLDRPPSFLQRFLPQFDVLILNTGHHWNRGKVNANRWVMHSDGKPVKNKRLAMVGNAKNFTIHSVARWLDNQLQHHPHIKAFFRTISPRHFFNGDWNTGGSCENTTPLAKGSAVLQNESSDPVIAGAVKGTRVRLLDITALSTLRDEGHISRFSTKTSQGIQDCLHWCLPGIPDTWNEIVAAQL